MRKRLEEREDQPGRALRDWCPVALCGDRLTPRRPKLFMRYFPPRVLKHWTSTRIFGDFWRVCNIFYCSCSVWSASSCTFCQGTGTLVGDRKARTHNNPRTLLFETIWSLHLSQTDNCGKAYYTCNLLFATELQIVDRLVIDLQILSVQAFLSPVRRGYFN